MRKSKAAVLTGLALAAVAACSEPIASPLTAPENAASRSQGSDSKGNEQDKNKNEEDKDKDKDKDKITICHAAGLAGSAKYVEITVSRSASYAHLDEHGTPKAGHEKDYVESDGEHGCKGQTKVTKTLVRVMTTSATGAMIDDPTWKGGTITIPAGETRWLFFRIDYTLPTGVTGTITENHKSVCATAGPGINCDFNLAGNPNPPGGNYVFNVSGSSSLEVQIDLRNPPDYGGVCGDRTFTNTVVLTPSAGTPITASASAHVKFVCVPGATLTKTLVRVMTTSATGAMIDDPTWKGGTITIPAGETRWLTYRLTYTLPTGATGTIAENHNGVCSTAAPGINCDFNLAGNPNPPGGNYVFNVSGSSSLEVQIDLRNPPDYGGVCATKPFTNTAVLKPSTGAPVTASATNTVVYVCKK